MEDVLLLTLLLSVGVSLLYFSTDSPD